MNDPASKVRVLVVDDVPDANLVTAGLLESLGCEVDAAEGGSAALDLLGRNNYQMVLLDCHMPLMDGYEVVRAIRQLPSDNPTPPVVPVIGLTAMAYAGEREKALAAGMDECLGKPVTRAHLREILEKWGGGAPAPLPGVREAAPPTVSASPRFRQLLEQLGSDLMARVMKLYLAELMPRVQALEGAISRGDTLEARRIAHALKSASGNVGASALEEIGLSMEEAALEGNLALLAILIDPLKGEASRAMRELPEWTR